METIAWKSWISLTDVEKREAIMKRLGRPWRKPTHGSCCTCQICGDDRDTCICGVIEDDGLAFTEVWPKLERSGLMLAQIPSIFRRLFNEADDIECLYNSGTYADVICLAAYELLPEVK